MTIIKPKVIVTDLHTVNQIKTRPLGDWWNITAFQTKV